MARSACTCAASSVANNLCSCFQSYSVVSSSDSPNEHAPPPRCLLLGPGGSGKTTFLYRVKTGEFFDVQPTNGFNVEEIRINKKGDTIIFSEVGGTDRRNIRLQFLQSFPILGISILFFIDVTTSPKLLREAFEELIYVISYTQARGCHIHYLGIVLNKQDLLNPQQARRRNQAEPRVDLEMEWLDDKTGAKKYEVDLMDGQSDIVKWIKRKMFEALEEHKLAQPEDFSFQLELLHSGLDGKGVSMRTGDGVQDVFRRLVLGMKAGKERGEKKRALGLDQVTSGV